MNDDVLVEVENVSKRFCKDFKRSIRYGFMDSLRALMGKDMDASTLRKDEFWSVKDVSFQLKRGECLGLIGHNGAGKSTLLKMLNGLIRPDHGKIIMRGKIGALIELGAGFSPILTGRENIYNNAAVLGFSKKEIDDRFQDIIDFSEIGEFLNMPVQNYSSGMRVRLGFAVASFLSPDILLIDEVLAVGDLGFVLKCFKRIDNILPNTAIIFVSHSMPMIARICSQIILMDHGKVEYQGNDVAKAIDLYYSHFASSDTNILFSDGSVELKKAELLDLANINEAVPKLIWKNDLRLRFNFRTSRLHEVPVFVVTIFDKEQRPVAQLESNKKDAQVVNDNGEIKFVVCHQNMMLSKGIYNINISVNRQITNEPLLRINNIINFQILHKEEIWPPFLLDASYENV